MDDETFRRLSRESAELFSKYSKSRTPEDWQTYLDATRALHPERVRRAQETVRRITEHVRLHGAK